jgi:phosphoribosylformylglycinamidine synthase
VPFISGKDSLNNEYRLADGTSHPIPGTLLISAMGIVPDIRRTMSMYLKRPGNAVYLVGLTGNDLGGSLALRLDGRRGRQAPEVRLGEARRIFGAVYRAIRSGVVQACHDLSEGGLAVAAAEMAFAGGHGVEIDLRDVLTSETDLPDSTLLFAESPTRFLVEVDEEDAEGFERILGRVPHARIGRVIEERRVLAVGDGGAAIDADIDALRDLWRAPLTEATR